MVGKLHPISKKFMNQSFIAPAFLLNSTTTRARHLRRGLLLSGATGAFLAAGAPSALAQSLVPASVAPVATTSSEATLSLLKSAHVQEAAGSLALASVQLRAALTQAPRDPNVARELARFYMRQNRLEEASIEWKRVLILRGQDAEATRQLASLSRLAVAASPDDSATGVADVAPLPAVRASSAHVRAQAVRRAKKSALPPVGAPDVAASNAVGPMLAQAMDDAPAALPSASASASDTPAGAATEELSDAPASAPVASSTDVAPIPFSLPARGGVSVSKKSRAAAFPFVNRAARLLQAGQTQAALEQYGRGAELDPSNAYALPGVATAQLILGRFDESAATQRRFLAVAPASAVNKSLRDLANALTYGRRYREALGVNAFILSRQPNSFDAAFQNGQIYTYLRSYSNADAAFGRALTLQPGRADVLAAYGESLSYRRDPRAVEIFQRGLQLQPGNARLTLGLANYYSYAGQFGQAVPLLRAVVAKDTSNIPALVALGDALSYSGQAGSAAEAVGYYARAHNLAPNNTSATVGLGRALVYSGRYADGARLLNAAVAANPNDAGALEALALAQSTLKSPNAGNSFRKLLALQTDPAARARTFASLGDLQLGRNDLTSATQSYAQAAQLAPQSVKINLVYAQLLSYVRGNGAATAGAARRVLALSPNNPQALAILLRASLETGDRATATQIASQLQNSAPGSAEDSLALAQALRDASLPTDPADASSGNPALREASKRLLLRAASQVNNPATALRLADATRDAGDYPTAIALYQRLLQAQPNNVGARLGLVKTLFYSNQTVEAQTQAAALLASSPNNPDVQILAAQIQMRVGTPEARDQAARLANAVLTQNPRSAAARTLLSQALVTRQRFAEALQQAQAAVAADPNNLDARLALAQNLNYTRDIEGAIAQYRSLIQLAPADTTPRLELAQILLDRGRYAEAEALFNEVLVLRRGTALLPSVRRAIASNSLRRLSPISTRGLAQMRPRAHSHRVAVTAPHAKARRLFAQNSTVSSPASPASPAASGNLGSANALPDTSAGASSPAPSEAAPVTSEVPSTPAAPSETAPATSAEPTTPATPDTSTGTTLPSAPITTLPSSPTQIESPAPSTMSPTDSPLRAPSDAAGAALRGLGESRLRQSQYPSALEFFNRALALNASDYIARTGAGRALRGQNQFPSALQQVQQALTVEANYIPGRVLQAQLLADTGQTDAANAQLQELITLIGNQPAGSVTQSESYTQLALALNSLNQFSTSLQLLNRAVAQYPSEPSLERLRAETLGFTGQTDEAASAFDRLIAADPRDVDAVIGKARVYNYANRLPESETTYRQALALSSANSTAQGELAEVLGRSGKYTEAISLYQSAITADPSKLTFRVNLARLQRSNNQAADAEATLNQVLDADANNVDALVERGLIRGTAGNSASALADINRALSIAPNSPTAQLGLAEVQQYAGNFADSITSYETFLKTNPTNARARTELAQVLSYAGRNTEALSQLDTVLAKTPNDDRALLVRADVLARSNRAPEAIAIYNALLTREPNSIPARVGLGDALLYARRYPDAIRTYDAILASEPNNTAVRISRARALSYEGRAREAVTALRAIVASDASNVPARLALAEAGANSGNATLQRDAIGEYRAVLKDNPDNLNAQLGLARVLSYRGQNGEAKTVLTGILRANPANPEARVALGDVERFSGKPFAAKKQYRLAKNGGSASAATLASARKGLRAVNRDTTPSLGVAGSYYHDTNGIILRSVGENAILRTPALTIGVLADQGRFRQRQLAARNRRDYGILLARGFGPFAAQLIVSRLKYTGVKEKTLFDLSLNRTFSPRQRVNFSVARRDVFETDLAVGRGITADVYNVSASTPLGSRFDLDGTATYYDYSDNNSRYTLSPSLMFRFAPTNPTLRVGVGYTYDNTRRRRGRAVRVLHAAELQRRRDLGRLHRHPRRDALRLVRRHPAHHKDRAKQHLASRRHPVRLFGTRSGRQPRLQRARRFRPRAAKRRLPLRPSFGGPQPPLLNPKMEVPKKARHPGQPDRSAALFSVVESKQKRRFG